MQEGVGIRLIFAGGNDAGFLYDRGVPIGGDQFRFAVLDERQGRENGVGVSAIEELQGLADILAIYDFAFERGPKASVFQRLLSGRAVGSQAWIGQRYETNPILR